MRTATLLGLLAGCPKAPTGTPPAVSPAAPVVEAPSATPDTAPWPTTLPTPPARRGSGGATDLRALAASQDIFTVQAALPSLAGAQDTAKLQATLEADPRWRVGRWGEDLVAWRRCRQPDGTWAASWAGYCTADGGEWRVMLVLTGTAPEDADAAADGSFKVRAGPSAPEGWRSGTLRAAGPGAWLEIHERATELTLQQTATALATLDGELRGLLATEPTGPGGWFWADVPGQQAVSAERVRGALPPVPDPPGTAQRWLMWDGQAPEKWTPPGS